MKAEVSCLNTRAILAYLQRRALDPRQFISGLAPELDALGDPLAYLADRNNWVPTVVVSGLFARLRVELDDEQLAFKIGHESVVHRRFGYIQNIFLRLFLSPEQGLRKAQEVNDRFNRTKRVELVELSEGRAVIRLTWHPGLEHSKDICLYNQGIYSAITQVWGIKPASVTETQCAFEGGGCCEYRLRWQAVARPFGLFKRYFIPRALFQETVRELEEDKELLSQKYREVQDLTGRLRRKIGELETIHESGKAIVSLLDRRELLNVIMRLTTSSLGYDRGIILLHSEEEQALVTAASCGGELELMRQFGGYRVPLSRTSNILVRTFDTGKPALVEDAARHGLNRKNPLLKAFMPTSFVVVPLISRGKVIGVMAADRVSSLVPLTPEDLDSLSGFGNHVAVALENSRLYESLEHATLDAIQALAKAVEAKDPYTHGHSERVAAYSEQLAAAIGLGERQLLNLRLACTIHDIGKIGVAERILHKPGRLDLEEQSAIKHHPVIGETIIRPLKGLGDIARIIRNHHERYDGLGYPDRLRGEEIPVEARIIAIADSFDAMTTTRPYRIPLPEDAVVRELVENRGRQFDPHLVDVFLQRHGSGRAPSLLQAAPCPREV
ncbi:MAG TPA: HD domain-containing phosphohydrolase [Candidatus Methanoperedens sp.]|nr:HD domain-containing phosphohydrolase [Candidatus Methanoperedens sp.]